MHSMILLFFTFLRNPFKSLELTESLYPCLKCEKGNCIHVTFGRHYCVRKLNESVKYDFTPCKNQSSQNTYEKMRNAKSVTPSRSRGEESIDPYYSEYRQKTLIKL